MALFKREVVSTGASGLETVLGTSTNFQGVLKSDGNIRVDGMLQGRIETAGNLVIGPTARVIADIRANAVQVWGHIQGNISTAGRLEILSSGRVFGEVTVGSLMIDEGGLFRGQCYMDGQDVDALPIGVDPRLLIPGQAWGEDEPAPGTDIEHDATGHEPANSQAAEGNAPDATEPQETRGE